VYFHLQIDSALVVLAIGVYLSHFNNKVVVDVDSDAVKKAIYTSQIDKGCKQEQFSLQSSIQLITLS